MINKLFYRFEALWPKILPPDLKTFVHFFFAHPLEGGGDSGGGSGGGSGGVPLL